MSVPLPEAAQPQNPAPVGDQAAVVTRADATVADMRAVARWTIMANAAVGGLLLAGFPLAAIGRIHGLRDTAVAAGGLALALVGVFWAIWWTGEVLTPRFTTLRSLQDPALADLRAEIADAPKLFFGPFGTTVDQLGRACELHTTVAVNLTERLARERDEDRRAELDRALTAARVNIAHATARRRALVELVHAWQVRAALRRARAQTMLGSLLVVAGAVLFLLATDKG
ncbi:hypothetical protein PV416_09920 [Streptomyces ipomoeae]|uniref:hypothetical protein n=1 Tax=Streptomyces ipomoeae TaxID=103232 RepID=UPI0029A797C3|nr:hypothetical protein [Streptomyces ipomoeae]MDX2821397.1 hypothetical protein [Streptomyces ipomoeae]MDX2880727.1 hypothetical protein [Streptomyces ipomoeae]